MNTPYRHLLPLLTAALALTGCQGNGGEPDDAGLRESPRFTATIGTQSRASDTSWDAGDMIGISGGGSSNICHITKNGDGSFDAAEGAEPIYFRDESEVTFTAYYPWTELAEGETSVKTDTKDQATPGKFDFLWASGKGSKKSREVALTFSHRMAKVVIDVKPGEDVAFDELEGVAFSLTGCRHAGHFDIEAGTVGLDADASAEDWDFSTYGDDAEDGQSRSFSLILFPQEFGEGSPVFEAELDGITLSSPLDFTSANKKDGEEAKNAWTGGRQYTLNVTLNRTSMQMGDIKINDWDWTEPLEVSPEKTRNQ